jgi:Protein of unknown function (DUF3179).
VLSRDTGHDRPYGRNPYAGYDDIDNKPFAYRGPTDDRLPPMAKVVAVTIGDRYKAYPHSKTEKKRVLHDTVAGRPLAVFHAPGAVSALDAAEIAESKETGSTGVFDRRVDGRTLTFSYVDDGRFEDEDTGSTWTVTGRAVEARWRGPSSTASSTATTSPSPGLPSVPTLHSMGPEEARRRVSPHPRARTFAITDAFP